MLKKILTFKFMGTMTKWIVQKQTYRPFILKLRQGTAKYGRADQNRLRLHKAQLNRAR